MDIAFIRSKRVVFPDGERPATVHIREGRITAITPYDSERSPAGHTLDFGSLAVLPGLVDTHVHINEPGRTDWEGFETATRAAAAGGVTTVVDMPLNSIPATADVAALDAKRRAAQGKCHVDVALWGGVVPGNAAQLEPLAHEGVFGFKCFMSPSGVEEFDHVSEADLRMAMPIVSRLRLPLLVHAELPEQLRPLLGNPREYATWLASRPAAAERAAIELLIRLSEEYGTHVHVVHLACGDALPMIEAARAQGIQITVETCPHYLTFSADDVSTGSTAFKCAPPIRELHHREELWNALADGRIDLVATDHSPAPAALKELETGDFVKAWGGIASLQLGLQAVWTGAAARGLSLAQTARWMSEGPATLAGLHDRKGSIAVGRDGDFVIVDPDATVTVDSAKLYHRHPVTPYHGRHLRGRVDTTVLRGTIIFQHGSVRGPSSGRLLRRGQLR